MKKFILLLFFVSYAHGQKPTAISTFSTQADYFAGVDAFGFYYLQKNATLIKTNGTSTMEFQDVRLGKISRLDIKNPLLLVLFYEAFNTVVLLDNQLNEVMRIDFNKKDEPLLIKAIGLASRNKLWLYEGMQQQLFLYDYKTNKMQAIGIPFCMPIYYETDFNYFLWVDRDNKAYRTDVFGRVQPYGLAPKSSIYSTYNNAGWLGLNEGKINLYDAEGVVVREVMPVGNSFKNFFYHEQILSIFTDHTISNFNLKLP